MTNPFKIFKIKKEERWLALAMLLIFAVFNGLMIASHYAIYTKGVYGGFYSIFYKHFCMSGYDCWAWLTISHLDIHFTTIRHPLYLTFLYPMYLLNHWLLQTFGYNCTVFFMAGVLILSALYSAIFMYRILREVLELKQIDATLLTFFLFSFGHVLVPAMTPDHFIISMMLLTITLYIAGVKIKKHIQLKPYQTMLLLFFTAGMSASNGVKTILSSLFANGRKFFTLRNLLLGIIFPLVTLIGIQQCQYQYIEGPQKEIALKVKKRQQETKDSKQLKQQKAHQQMIDSKVKPAGNGFITRVMDVETPRIPSIIENFLGESIQIHQEYPLEDVLQKRPVFVSYSWMLNYIIEFLIVALFAAGIWRGRKEKFLWMLLSWWSFDLFLHLVLGFGLNEVYIMTAGWAFIIPIAIGYLFRRADGKQSLALRAIISCITLFLWVYNSNLIIHHLFG